MATPCSGFQATSTQPRWPWQNGNALKFVLDYLRTEELALAAVQQNGDALEFVPEPLRAKETIALAAVRQTHTALRWATTTPALCMAELLVSARLRLAG